MPKSLRGLQLGGCTIPSEAVLKEIATNLDKDPSIDGFMKNRILDSNFINRKISLNSLNLFYCIDELKLSPTLRESLEAHEIGKKLFERFPNLAKDRKCVFYLAHLYPEFLTHADEEIKNDKLFLGDLALQ